VQQGLQLEYLRIDEKAVKPPEAVATLTA